MSRVYPAHNDSVDNADVESKTYLDEMPRAADGHGPMESAVKKPFWRTSNGLIILAIIALVIIAAAVGEHR